LQDLIQKLCFYSEPVYADTAIIGIAGFLLGIEMKIITLTEAQGKTRRNIFVDKITMFSDSSIAGKTIVWMDADNFIGVMETKEEIIELIRNAEVL